MNLLSLIVLALRGQGKIILRAKWDAIKGLSVALRKRRRQQRQVTVSSKQLQRLMESGWVSLFQQRRR